MSEAVEPSGGSTFLDELENVRLLEARRINVHLLAMYRGREIIVKISAPEKYATRRESVWYKTILSAIRDSATPHLLECFGAWPCRLEDLPSEVAEIAIPLLKLIDQSRCDISRGVKVLALERVKNYRLFDFYLDSPSLRDTLCVMYQALYTLDCFDRLDFRHNDLHPANILVQSLPDEEIYTYHDAPRSKATEHVILRTRVKVLIIDFEHASMYPRGNFLASNPCHDVYMFVSRLYKFTLGSPLGDSLRPWFEKITDLTWLQNKLSRDAKNDSEILVSPAKECMRALVSLYPGEPFSVRQGKVSLDGNEKLHIYYPIDLA